MSDLIEMVSDEFDLTPVERGEMLASGTRRIASNVNWARTDLGKAGLIERVSRGSVRITDEGRRLLQEEPSVLTRRVLSQRYPKHAAFTGLSAPNMSTSPLPAATTETLLVAEAPEESIDRAFQTIQQSLAEDLIDRMKTSSAAFFERLVVQVLLAMGYGGSVPDAGQVLGRTGDGGIDGVIKEDKLGLDSIYVQAKRWDGTVGRPVVQAFVGSLMGQAATKGVLITTGTFSQDAQQYAKGLSMRIVLIDGRALARLMIDHGVGVTVASTYQLKRVDSDYFAEE